MYRVFCVLLLTATLSAQSVGTASRTVSLAPEEIVVEMLISTDNETQPEQAVALLAPLRITNQDLKSVGTLRDSQERLGWQYTFVRPYTALSNLVKQMEQLRAQLREGAVPMSYQFFLRPAPRTLEATKRRVLQELIAEAKRNAGGGKIRSVVIEPTPETIDAGRPNLLFGQYTGALQYHFSVTAVFDNE